VAQRLKKYDPRRARLLTARAWRGDKKQEKSWKELKDAIPEDLSAARPEDVELMVEAASLLLYEENEDWKQSVGTDYALKLADRAAELAPGRGLTRAEAKGAAGVAYWKLADSPSDDEKVTADRRARSLTELKAAIELDAGCRAQHGVEWRALYTALVLRFGDKNQKAANKEVMLKCLKEADQVISAEDADTKKRIGVLIKNVEKLE
jgi:hypothetical protein